VPTWLIIFDVLMALLAFGLFLRLRVVGRTLMAFGEWTGNSKMFSVWQIACWVFFFLILNAVMILVGGPLGFFLWLTTIVISLMVANRYRESEWRMLYWSLGVAAERGIPLQAAAHAFADERRDSIGRRARTLALALEAGMSLEDALETSGAALPTEALLAVRTGAHTDQLASRLKGVGQAGNAAETSARATMSQFTYLSVMICFAAFVVTFLMYRIVPEYIKIFDSFNIQLPAITILFASTANFFASAFFLYFLFVLLLTTLFLIARYIGLVRWDPPLVRRFTRPLDEAIVLRSLGRSVSQQQTLPAAVETLARFYPKRYVRRRLLTALHKIDDGGNWCDGLIAAGLLQPVAANVLKSAERVDNLAWALNEMADRQVRRFVVRMATVRSIAFPAAILVVAIVVGGISIGMFLPLVTLIQGIL